MFDFLKKKLKNFEDQIEAEIESQLDEELKIDTRQPEKVKSEVKKLKATKPKEKTVDKSVKTKVSIDEKIEKSIESEIEREIKIQKSVEEATVDIKGKKEGKTPIFVSDEKLDGLLWDLEVGLLEADVALSVVDSIKQNIKLEFTRLNMQKAKVGDVVEDALRRAVSAVLKSNNVDFYDFVRKNKKPVVVMFIGVNGGGKTTAIAKIAYQLKKDGLFPVIAAADTFRAGAIEQIEEHANKIGVKVIKHGFGADPAAVAFDAIQHAKSKHKDVVLLDTAGRMQTNVNLMEEMEKIKRVAKPDMIIFVGDALSGNDAVEQAKRFDEIVGIDGVILTKVDADAKGGSALSIAYTIGKPLLFIGLGQGYDDQIPFNPDWMLEHIFAK
ncbi:signal recognition particle-docking protein FtsY [Thermoplasmatales archaeon SCGC AB-539-N05]|nr:signal recognition particle-docking protein FtsY [Thermoplasmatales archaeon SCGC AB-539-N05]